MRWPQIVALLVMVLAFFAAINGMPGAAALLSMMLAGLLGVDEILRARPTVNSEVRSPLTEQLERRDYEAYIDRLEREARVGPYAD